MTLRKNALGAIALILLIQFVVTFEMNVVFPLTPSIAQVYGVPTHQVAYMNIGNAVFGMLAPLIGFASDKTGIKKMIGFTLFLFFLGSLMIGLVPSLLVYVIGRSLTGLAFFTMLGLGLNYLSLLVPHDKLGVVSGLHRIAFALGVLVSPFIGTFLIQYFNFQAIYLALSGVIVFLLVVFMLVSPEIKTTQDAISLDQVVSLIKGKKEQRMILITFLMSTPAIFFFNYLSVYLDGQGLAVDRIAFLYTIIAIGSTLGGFFIMAFSDKMGKFKMITLVSSLIPLVLLGFYFSQGWLLLAVGLSFGFLFDSATGLLFPVGSLIVHQYKATFLTILSLTMSFVNVVSNIIAPTLYSLGGFLLLIGIIAVCILISSLMLRSIQA